MQPLEFQDLIWQKGRELYRQMPWRENTEPYYILVSELMLQQTQVDRVIPKFNQFISLFPTIDALADATLADVITSWSGLGYNRRAKYLHDAAKMLCESHSGNFPQTRSELLSLPGVGPGTSGAIMVYAYNKPEVFIETNIRTVYFEHFFTDRDQVSDVELADVVASTIDTDEPRGFYWALMDYGSWLKRQGASRLRQSSHYKKQSPLKGSVREVRGVILMRLSTAPLDFEHLQKDFNDDARLGPAIEGLLKDGLISQSKGVFHLTK